MSERVVTVSGYDDPSAHRSGRVVAMGSGSPPLDSAIMARVAKGDRDAFAELYDGTVRVVYGTVLRIIRDPAQAEDVTQEVYVEAWRLAPRFDLVSGSPAAWLTMIARSRAIDAVRSVERRRLREGRHVRETVSSAERDTGDVVADSDESARVRRALESLPPAQRTAVELVYFDGKTQRDVSESLQVPLGTVKTRIRDGLRRLRAQLGEGAP
jgi:RNA polymerase sigma-70 factor (ECF subfamily)